jgi:hypothetical protein
VLRTRSPLDLSRCCHRLDLVRLACVKHAASVRPEPGSNSPSRPRLAGRAHQRRSESRPLRADWHNCFPRQNRGVCGIDMRSRSQLLGHRSPALAFVRPLFRFQGATQPGARVSHEAEVPLLAHYLWLRAVVADRRLSDRRQSDHGGGTDAGWPVAPHRRRPERVHILRPAARKCQSEPQARGNTSWERQDAPITTR